MRHCAKIALTCITAVQCLVGCGSADTKTSTSSSPLFNDNSLLWEVTSQQGAVSHVFGTIHVSDTLVFQQRDTVLAILDKATSFWAEINLDSAKDLRSGMGLISKLMLTDGKSLADFYSPTEYARIHATLVERFGSMAPVMERLKPGALVGILMMDTVPTTAEMSVDEFLWRYATAKKIPVNGIERTEEQITILDSMPSSILLEAIDADSSQNIMLKQMLQAYANEDIGHVVALVDSLSTVESFMLTINDKRNVTMANRLQNVLNRGGAFIAIGTAHLGGKQGFLAELHKQGYEVRPVVGGKRIQWLAR